MSDPDRFDDASAHLIDIALRAGRLTETLHRLGRAQAATLCDQFRHAAFDVERTEFQATGRDAP